AGTARRPIWPWSRRQASSPHLCFFFSSRRRHTRSYGDWSSDVCSSDLRRRGSRRIPARRSAPSRCATARRAWRERPRRRETTSRSEERRVGKECKSEWSAKQKKKKNDQQAETDLDSALVNDGRASITAI